MYDNGVDDPEMGQQKLVICEQFNLYTNLQTLNLCIKPRSSDVI